MSAQCACGNSKFWLGIVSPSPSAVGSPPLLCPSPRLVSLATEKSSPNPAATDSRYQNANLIQRFEKQLHARPAAGARTI